MCTYCRSLLVRRDLNLETLGVMAELPPDTSVIQLGTQGKFKGVSFLVVGRLRMAWEDGLWNEWYIVFGDNRDGWLAEFQGTYAVSLDLRRPSLKIPDRNSIGIGQKIGWSDDAVYEVQDIRQVTCTASEGELPFASPAGRRFVSVDLTGPDHAFACLDYSDEGSFLYFGETVEFDELYFSNLKEIDAENGADGKTRKAAVTFSCTACKGSVEVRAAGSTLAVVCGSCGSVLDAADPNHRILSEAKLKIKEEPLIPLGSRGRIKGDTFEVIGFMKRFDPCGEYWSEYLLFHPYRGFRWLTEFNGHWNFVNTTRQKPEIFRDEAACFGKKYKLFYKGSAKVVYVLGEFYWRVKVGDRVEFDDYINPPEILSCEKDKNEITWSVGEYLQPEEIGEAFGISASLPARTGVASNQPSPVADRFKAVGWWWLGFAAVLLFIQIVTAGLAADEEVLTVNEKVTPGLPWVSPSFRLEESGNLAYSLNVPEVDNDWFGADIDLINEDTGKIYEQEIGVEYYHGYEGGESWSEGSHHARKFLSAIPPGRYHLVADFAAGSPFRDYTAKLTVRRDVPIISNFGVMLLAVSAYPLFVFLRKRAFEKNRWSQSDYSPYESEDDD